MQINIYRPWFYCILFSFGNKQMNSWNKDIFRCAVANVRERKRLNFFFLQQTQTNTAVGNCIQNTHSINANRDERTLSTEWRKKKMTVTMTTMSIKKTPPPIRMTNNKQMIKLFIFRFGFICCVDVCYFELYSLFVWQDFEIVSLFRNSKG